MPRVRFSYWELMAFSFGGMIGSGWLLGAGQVDDIAHGLGWLSWLFAGLVVLIIGVVMMELGRAWGQDGGLVWWPLKSSGPAVAMAVAAAAWIFYAVNPASEAEATTQFVGQWVHGMVSHGSLTWIGLAFGAALVILLAGINVLGLQLVKRISVAATVLKVVVPVVVLALLIRSGIGSHAHTGSGQSANFGDVLRAITSGGVIYAYTGFQAPVDFGGRVRNKRDMDRLPWAVIVPILFGLVVFTSLQWLSMHDGLNWQGVGYNSPYARLATGIAVWRLSLAWLVKLDEVVSPLGCGLIFTAALGHTTESISLHGLIPPAFSSKAELRIGNRVWLVAWFALSVNALLSLLVLACLRTWATLAEASGIMTLFVYAIPSVSHAALLRHTSERGHTGPLQQVADSLRSAGIRSRLAPVSFWLMTVILYWSDRETLLVAAGLILAGAALLIVLRPPAWREDQTEPESQTWQQWRDSRRPAWWLATYGCGLVALCWLRGNHSSGTGTWLGMATALALAIVMFQRLVVSSAEYMSLHPPRYENTAPDHPPAKKGGESEPTAA
jgi:amino acid transporter